MIDVTSFANRLRKMARHYDKWARRQGISCYRVYDADVPEFPLAIDRYDRYVHAAEYRREHGLSPEEYRGWRFACREVMAEVLDVPLQHIFFKEREPQRGSQQYEKRGDAAKEVIVKEGGLQFLVNLSDYLDTGLFLDHRITRSMVRELSAGRRVLNLFAYTGSFTVYAADGGATHSLTIDLSNTYLAWAEQNFTLNGMDPDRHRLLRADVKAWLAEPVRERFDLIVLDPPTFSNSKAMSDLLDTQRDHVALINACLTRLTPGGHLFFSTNYRRFKLDEENIHSPNIQDISAATIPLDFRNQRIHYCWKISPDDAGRR